MKAIKLFALGVLLCLAGRAYTQDIYHPIDTVMNYVSSISFSPDGSLFAVIHQPEQESVKSIVKIYSAATEKKVAEFKLSKNTSWATFSPDNHTLLIGDRSYMRLTGDAKGSTLFVVNITDLNDIKMKRQEDLPEQRINACSYSPDGRYYLYGFDNGQLLVFAANNNELVLRAQHTNRINYAEFFSNDVIALAENGQENLVLYRISNKSVLAKIPAPDNKYTSELHNGTHGGNRYVITAGNKAYLYALENSKPLASVKAGMHTDRSPKQFDVALSPNGEMMAKIGEDKLTLYHGDFDEGGIIEFEPTHQGKWDYYRFHRFTIGNRSKVVFIKNKTIYCGNYSDFLALANK